MRESLYGLIVIVVACALVVVVANVLAVPITGNLVQVEQAKASQAQERTAQVTIQETGHTERMQAFALTLTGLVVIAKSPDAAFMLLVLGLYGAAGIAIWRIWRNRARG